MKFLKNLTIAALIMTFYACIPSDEQDGFEIGLNIMDAPDSIMVSLFPTVNDNQEVLD